MALTPLTTGQRSAVWASRGLTAAQLSGVWTLSIIDVHPDDPDPNPPPCRLDNWSLNFTSGLTLGADIQVATTPVFGAISGAFPLQPAVSPDRGIGPGISIASDNTLGSFSPYQGRLYVAYTGRGAAAGNPADNTDVYLTYSDDAGATWSVGAKVNDDSARADGFSEAAANSGRPQFQPSVAVDQSTGTLVMTWYDARYDAARARAAMFVGASIDGGTTFAPQTFLNTPNVVTDAITGNAVALGPIPDNVSAGNAIHDATFGFGTRQSVIALPGKIVAAWSGNANGGTNGGQRLAILEATATMASGPRIVSSTMGPVSQAGDTLNPAAADGTPLASAIFVQFDRPINPNSFNIGSVTVTYRDVNTPGSAAGVDVPLGGVEVVDEGTWGPAGIPGATQFVIHFLTPQSGIGTYSYTIMADMSDRIRTSAAIVAGASVNYAAAGAEINLPISDTLPPTVSTIPVAGVPANEAVFSVKVNVDLTHTHDSDLVLTLIAPSGRRIVLARNEGADGQDYTGTVFDDLAVGPISAGTAPFTGSFQPEDTLSGLNGGVVNGDWQLQIVDESANEDGILLGWSLDIQTLPVNRMDQDADGLQAEVPTAGSLLGDAYAAPMPRAGSFNVDYFTGPFDNDTLPLIVPGPHIIGTSLDGYAPSTDNLALNGLVSSIDVTFDRDMDPTTFTGTSILRITGSTGLVTGPHRYSAWDVGQQIPDGPVGRVTSVLPISEAYRPGDINVLLDITHPHVSDLQVVLIAPDGTRIPLITNQGGTGANFSNTLLDDSATTPIANGTAPFSLGYGYKPETPLSTLLNLPLLSIYGTWGLEITDTVVGGGAPATLNGWSLIVTPDASCFQVLPNPDGTDPTPGSPRTYRILFPPQSLSGTYTLSLASSIQSAAGDALDTNLNAGLEMLRGEVLVPTPGVTANNQTPATYTSANVPQTITSAAPVRSTLNIGDNFTIQGVSLQLNITYAHDPDLSATLIAPDGTRIKLFTSVGAGGASKANFTNTVFSDQDTTTPVQNGAAPFFGRFIPQESLNVLVGTVANSTAPGLQPWTLEITSTGASTGTLNGWSLTFLKDVLTTGLGEIVADQASVSFRIFTMDPTDDLSHSEWTAVGPASEAGRTGRIGGLAVDPSDVSGNTVYVGGASGGIWKTTNFLTTDSAGPTYIPLTDFGPTHAINIGGIAIFSRNGDPNQSIVFGATGEGDVSSANSGMVAAASPGVGVIRSMDGGATWTVLDSTTNVDANGNPLPMNSPLRDHAMVGTAAYKIVVDPHPTPSGEAVVYVAFTGLNGGIWRSLDSGKHWARMLAGDATDVVLDPASGSGDAIGNPTGNLQIVYAAIRGTGIYMSPNRGGIWNQLLGGIGSPLIRNADVMPTTAVPVTNPTRDPSGQKGRICLAKPELIDANGVVQARDGLYQGWLYALVVAPSNVLDGLYMTKDFGKNWTYIPLNSVPSNPTGAAVPSNDPGQIAYPIFGTTNGQGNYDVSFAIDPNNPNVVYIGGKKDNKQTGTNVMRVDTTGVADPGAFYLGNNNPDGGSRQATATSPAQVTSAANPPNLPPPGLPAGTPLIGSPITNPMINLQRDPTNPFASAATLYVTNTARMTNTGYGATWTPFDAPVGGNDHHRMITFRDPLTGHTRLIFGNDHTVTTGVDDNGTYTTGIGTATLTFGNRTGNLQATQFYYGAVAPSDLAAAADGAMFFGSAQDLGANYSSTDPLSDGNILWPGPNGGDSGGVAVDQTGAGNVYRENWPCCGGGDSNFFQVNGVGRTWGLLQPGDDPANKVGQWPALGTINFAVNPINGQQIVISSSTGNIFSTSSQGAVWTQIGALGSQSLAMAYGAPDPADPTGALNNFIYVGTNSGAMWVTFAGGGGGAGNAWIDLSAGLSGAVQSIVPNPQRGSHEAYAVTSTGVFYMADSKLDPINNPTPTWVDITGNLWQIQHIAFDNLMLTETQVRSLTSLQIDWRYVIADDPAAPNGPTHPVLFVGGEGGVFRSVDNGATWAPFPDQVIDGAVVAGGYLPNAHVTDLDMAIGNIDSATGRAMGISANGARSPNLLVASTYGRGTFAIRLSPIIVPGSALMDRASDTGFSDTDLITRDTQPWFSGQSQQTAFGSTVHVTLMDETDLLNPVYIGGYDGVHDSYVATATLVGHGFTTGDTVTIAGANEPEYNGTFAILVLDADHFAFTLASTPAAASATGSITVDDGVNPAQPIAPGGLTSTVSSVTDANGNFHFQVNPGLLAEGMKRIGIVATDDAGTVGAPYIIEFYLDTHADPPTVALDPASDSGLSNADGITNVRKPTLTGVAEKNPMIPTGALVVPPGAEGARVDIFLNTVEVATVVADPITGTYSYAWPANLADGVYSITVQQTDVAGNASGLSQPLMLTIDTVAPAAPGVPDLIDASDSGLSFIDNVTNVTLPTFVGRIEPNAELELLVNGTSVTTLIADAAGDYSFTLTNALTPDGTYLITARQTDVAGNVSLLSSALSVVIDTTAPVSTLAPVLDPNSDKGPYNNDNITNVTLPRVNGSAEPNATVELFVDGVSVGTATADSIGRYSLTLTNALADGDHLITAQQTDVAGNVAPISAPLTITIDTVAPAAPGEPDMTSATDSGLSQIDNITNNTKPTFTGTGDVGNYVQLLVGGVLNGAGWVNASGVYTIALVTAATDGVHTITARQQDLAGNNGPESSALSFTIDTIAPTSTSAPDVAAASDSGSSDTDNITNDNTPTLVGTAEPNAKVELFRNASPLGTVYADGTGAYTYDFAAPLADGTYSITARQTDVAGNVGPMSTALTLLIDTVAPVSTPTPDLDAASDTGRSQTDNITYDSTPTFTGVVESLAKIEIFANGVSTGSMTAAVNGEYAYTVGTPMADGVYAITGQQTDLAGNVGPVSVPLSVTIDLIAPAAPSTPDLTDASDTGYANNDNLTRIYTPTLTGTGEPNSIVDILSAGTSIGSGVTDATGAWSVTTRILADGTYALIARQTDVAGNVSPESVALFVTIDTTPPPAPVAAPDLTAGSDSGLSQADNITRVVLPAFTGQVDSNTLVEILSDGAVVGSGFADAAGAYSITITQALADGTRLITSRMIDAAGNIGPQSPALSITIDTAAPNAPAAPNLTDATDTGISPADNITKVVQPDFFGTVEPNAFVQLIVDGTPADFAVVTGTGIYLITLASMLGDGTHTIAARQTDVAGNVSATSVALSVTIDTTNPVASGVPITGVGKVLFTATVAHFTDLNPPLLASIRWGDGATGSGNVAPNGAGGFDVIASHTYRRANTYTVSIDVEDLAGNLVTVLTTAVIAEPPVSAAGVNIAPTEYVALVSQAVATTDGPSDMLSAASATINWGDGTAATAGVISYNAAADDYSVLGNHTYTREGTYTVTTTVHYPGKADTVVTSTASVADAPLVVTGRSLTVSEGGIFSDVLAAFTNGDPTETTADVSATIDWGDGTVDAGELMADPIVPQLFHVLGTHTYIDGPATRAVVVSLTDVAGPTATANSSIAVLNVAPTPAISGDSAVLSQHDLTLALTVADPSVPDLATGFAIQIDWGDGSAPETRPAFPGNGASQAISHTYATAGVYTVVVSATDRDGGVGYATWDIEVLARPVLRNVVINGGATQRTTINTIDFQVVPSSIPASGMTLRTFKLLRDGNKQVGLGRARLSYDPATGRGRIDLRKLTLIDGDYQLQMRPASNALMALNFYRLAGDTNLDRIVNNKDVRIVRNAMGHVNPNAELDNGKIVNSKDLAIVRQNLGNRLSVPAGPLVVRPGYSIMPAPGVSFGTVAPGERPTPIDLVVKNGGTIPMSIRYVKIVGDKTFSAVAASSIWGEPGTGDFQPGETSIIRIYLSPTQFQPGNASLVFYTYTPGNTNIAKIVVPLRVAIR